MIELETHSVEETRALGARLADQLCAGDVVLLEGDLGAGKSEFTRGIARGLGLTGYVTSPSFTILQVYESGRLPLYHFDWYRLSGAEELFELALDEYLYDRGIAVVEWPSIAVEAIPQNHLLITLRATGESDRRFTFTTVGDFHPLDAEALEALA